MTAFSQLKHLPGEPEVRAESQKPQSPTQSPAPRAPQSPAPATPTVLTYALLGNPNTGKTTLFNRLCGLRSKTANFPGSTVEAHIGEFVGRNARFHIVDLPGMYGLNLDRPESKVCRDYLSPVNEAAAANSRFSRPDATLVVVDAANLSRNLLLVNQVLQQGLPAVVALNMIDIAQRRGLTIDVPQLSEYLGVPVVAICARTGEGVDRLEAAMKSPIKTTVALPLPSDSAACARWAEGVASHSVGGDRAIGDAADTLTNRLDAAFTHPLIGMLVFAAVMTGLFYTIFSLAEVPMTLIELLFSSLGAGTHELFLWLDSTFGLNLRDGAVHDLMVNGVIPGIAGTVVFLPQICLLFFLISLLEDTGYLARASFVMDRVLRRFGLPGQAFVPLLSAHACAIPAIMSARLIPDQRDRIASILVIPFLSCSARLPVYVLLISVLFADKPALAGLAFVGCYLLGAAAALLTALLFRRTILKGPARPMVLELPSYKMPSIRTALLTTYDRAMTFLRKAGTVIVAICIVLWWLGAYPVAQPPVEAQQIREQSLALAQLSPEQSQELAAQADSIERKHAKAQSFVGKIGKTVEPVFAPLGYDWQVSVGVLSSFLAREVFVSSLAVVLTGSEEDEAESDTVREAILVSTRSDGSPVFTTATAASLLVFYVLAMQCLPTLAVTRRETASWKWPALQFGYMTTLAYLAAMLTYHAVQWSGAAA